MQEALFVCQLVNQSVCVLFSHQEVAEPLQDLKEGMEQLEKNKTLRYILSTLLAIGNFLNGSNVSPISSFPSLPFIKYNNVMIELQFAV